MNVLLIGDRFEIREQIKISLKDYDMQFIESASGSQGLISLKSIVPDLVILDDSTSDLLVFEFLDALHLHPVAKATPVLVTSARNSTQNQVRAFDHGADEFIETPFSSEVFKSRVKALLKRCYPVPKNQEFVCYGEIVVDLRNQIVKISDQHLEVTNTEFNIFKTLVQEKGNIVSRGLIIKEVLGGLSVTSRTVDVHICALRRKLRPLGCNIQTIRSRGYRLKCGTFKATKLDLNQEKLKFN